MIKELLKKLWAFIFELLGKDETEIVAGEGSSARVSGDSEDDFFVDFADYREWAEPDDSQTSVRRLTERESYPALIILDNGLRARNAYEKKIVAFEKDKPFLAEPLQLTGDEIRSRVDYTDFVTKVSKFVNIKNQPLGRAQKKFVTLMDSRSGIANCSLWGPATTLAHILYKRPDLAPRVRIISVGAWNKQQDESAHNYLWSIRGSLKNWYNSNTSFRGIYCSDPNRKSLVDQLRGMGALGAEYARVSDGIDTGSGTKKEGDTWCLIFVRDIIEGRKTWDNPSTPEAWAGLLKQDSTYPHIWSDGIGESACGYAGAGEVAKHVTEMDRSFLHRLRRK